MWLEQQTDYDSAELMLQKQLQDKAAKQQFMLTFMLTALQISI